MISLAAKYRPTTFEELCGQRLTALVLQRMVEHDRLPQAMLFSGPSGTGKTTAARIVAASLGTADIVEMDAASNGGVDEIRGITTMLQYGRAGSHQVIVIDEAHGITAAGFEALLKTIEEPPPGTVFILVTTEPNKIPETVLSRLVQFEFHRLTAEDIARRLDVVRQREGLVVSDQILTDIAQRVDGNLRSALMLVEQITAAGITDFEEYDQLVGDPDVASPIVEAIFAGDVAEALARSDAALQKLSSPTALGALVTKVLRDVLVLKSGGALPNLSALAAAARERIADRADADQVYAALRTLWDLKTRTKASEDPRGNLETAIALVTQIMAKLNPAPTVAPVAEATKRLSFAEIQARLTQGVP